LRTRPQSLRNLPDQIELSALDCLYRFETTEHFVRLLSSHCPTYPGSIDSLNALRSRESCVSVRLANGDGAIPVSMPEIVRRDTPSSRAAGAES
jgi:hypothetical protein